MKKITIFLCFVLAITLSSCGKKNSKEDEMIVDPEYIFKDYETSASEDGSLVVNGYYMVNHEMPKVTLFFPKIEDKKSGVIYVEDDYLKKQFNFREVHSFNKPNGTELIYGISNYNSTYSSGIFSGNIIPKFAEKYYSSDIPNWIAEDKGFGMFGFSDVEEKSSNDKLTDADVGAVSVALYEEFYGYSPTVEIKIYGIPNTIIKDKFGKIVGYKKYFEYERELIGKDYKSCTLLSEKRINKTGVYYIDFDDLNKKGNFFSYLISYHIDGLEDEYTFYISSAGGYNITDKSEFEQWKKEHAEQMINN